MLECWKAVYSAAHVDARDRIFFPFSFGPFLGFWTAFEAGCQLGAHCIPAGGMSSQARLALIDTLKPDRDLLHPYLRAATCSRSPPMGASRQSRSRRRGRFALLIVAGEPGGSIPSTRERIEKGWGARVIDHHGLTEVGPVSFECWESPGGLHVNEDEYICEVLEPHSDRVKWLDGERGELVHHQPWTSGEPADSLSYWRYCHQARGRCHCGRTFARLEGGILSRVDDMVNVRGVNVYPSAVEAIVRRFDEVAEYRATVARQRFVA